MSKHDKIIDNYFKHYSEAKSYTSYSYLVDYFLRKGLHNYTNPFVNLILNSNEPFQTYIRTIQSFYSHAIINNNFLEFKFILDLNKIFEKFSKIEIEKIYNEINIYLGEGKSDTELGKKLYDIFQDSILIEFWNKFQTQ